MSADSLIAEATDAVKAQLLSQLAPITQKISEAVAELEKALGGAKAGKRKGRPPKAAAGKAAPKRRVKKRTPRGALKSAVKDALTQSKAPLSLANMRDIILQTPQFARHDPKTLYTQIAQAVKMIPGVSKNAAKKYTLKAAPAAKSPAKKRGRKKA
jgi:hypothetical protein